MSPKIRTEHFIQKLHEMSLLSGKSRMCCNEAKNESTKQNVLVLVQGQGND